MTVNGKVRSGYCDGVHRRDFLKIGGLALGGLTLPQLLAAEARAGTGKSHKAVIMVFLAGGPPHLDMVDLKPDTPAEIRGEFKPIATNVPGLDVCEHMPRLARLMDKFVVIRSMVGSHGAHSASQCLTGYTDAVSAVQGGRPSVGAVLSSMKGPVDPAVPPFIGLSPRTRHDPWSNPGNPGFLGLAHAPFTPFRAEENDSASQGADIELGRLKGRRSLPGELDDLCRRLDDNEAIQGMDAFTQRAFDILTSRKLFDALDLTREDPRLRARYGVGDMKAEADGPSCCMDHFLMARRLVEAGARCVTISFGRWDTHAQNFKSNKERIPKLDMALSALIEDLYARGHLTRTSRWSSGESSAARPRSTTTPVATTGRRSRSPCWQAAACAPAKSSVQPALTPSSPATAPSPTRASSPRCTGTWASIPIPW